MKGYFGSQFGDIIRRSGEGVAEEREAAVYTVTGQELEIRQEEGKVYETSRLTPSCLFLLV